MTDGVDGLLRDKTRPARIPPLPKAVIERVVTCTLAEPPPDGECDRGGLLPAIVTWRLAASPTCQRRKCPGASEALPKEDRSLPAGLVYLLCALGMRAALVDGTTIGSKTAFQRSILRVCSADFERKKPIAGYSEAGVQRAEGRRQEVVAGTPVDHTIDDGRTGVDRAAGRE